MRLGALLLILTSSLAFAQGGVSTSNPPYTNAKAQVATGWVAVGNDTYKSNNGNVGIGTTITAGAALTVMNGSVGIGTWKPTQAIDIAGSGLIKSNLGIRFGNAGTVAGYLFPFNGSSYSVAAAAGKGLGFYSYSNTAGDIGVAFAGDTVTTTSAEYNNAYFRRAFQPGSGTATFNVLTIIATINQSAGGTGITRGLYISPTLTSPYQFRAIETVAGDVIIGTTSGNIGIGTTVPYEKLNIKSGNIRIDGTGGGNGILASSTGSNQLFSMTRQDGVNAGDLSISAYGGIGLTGSRTTTAATSGYAVYLNSGGNVGIGTTLPIQKLSLVSSGDSRMLFADNSASTDNKNWKFGPAGSILYGQAVDDANTTAVSWLNVYRNGISPTKVLFPSGNVGIGSSDPSQKLDVGGTIRAVNFQSIGAPTDGTVVCWCSTGRLGKCVTLVGVACTSCVCL